MLKKMFVIVKALRGLTVQCLAESCHYRYFKVKIPPSNSKSQIDDGLELTRHIILKMLIVINLNDTDDDDDDC